jgi:hypothetical protein
MALIEAPVTEDVAAALGKFFTGGPGPSHSSLTALFAGAGYGSDDPYNAKLQAPNKEKRIHAVLGAARRHPARAEQLIQSLLARLRVHGCFDPENENYNMAAVRASQRAFKRAGWQLTDTGELSALGAIDLATGGRAALHEQLVRLRRSAEDPGQLLGSAKDLLEAVAKYVLEEVGYPARRGADFGELWHLARERLGILPDQVAGNSPGSKQVRKILSSAWMIAEQVNELRGLQGTGHGRTLPTGVTAEVALLVVREACSVAEFTLITLDRTVGRGSDA